MWVTHGGPPWAMGSSGPFDLRAREPLLLRFMPHGVPRMPTARYQWHPCCNKWRETKPPPHLHASLNSPPSPGGRPSTARFPLRDRLDGDPPRGARHLRGLRRGDQREAPPPAPGPPSPSVAPPRPSFPLGMFPVPLWDATEMACGGISPKAFVTRETWATPALEGTVEADANAEAKARRETLQGVGHKRNLKLIRKEGSRGEGERGGRG